MLHVAKFQGYLGKLFASTIVHLLADLCMYQYFSFSTLIQQSYFHKWFCRQNRADQGGHFLPSFFNNLSVFVIIIFDSKIKKNLNTTYIHVNLIKVLL